MLLESKIAAAIIITKPIPPNPKNNFDLFRLEFEFWEGDVSNIWGVGGSILGIMTSGVFIISGFSTGIVWDFLPKYCSANFWT